MLSNDIQYAAIACLLKIWGLLGVKPVLLLGTCRPEWWISVSIPWLEYYVLTTIPLDSSDTQLNIDSIKKR